MNKFRSSSPGFGLYLSVPFYTTLDRLENKGYARSWFGAATEERGGRSKRFFEITLSKKQ
jgi:hypothetical protein